MGKIKYTIKYVNNLKVEFRAVPYTGDTHVLEYRISPDQDLNYTEEHKYLWGLIKVTRKHKYSTKWYEAAKFVNYLTAYRYTENENYLPIFIDNKSDLKYWQDNVKTIGEFFDKINKANEQEKEEWRKARKEYLDKQIIWN